jgi:hypothetical protein
MFRSDDFVVVGAARCGEGAAPAIFPCRIGMLPA